MKWLNWIRKMFASTTTNQSRWWFEWLGHTDSESGINVTPNTALTFAAVWQATNVISGDVGMLPIDIYKTGDNGDREIDKMHPARQLLRRPNDHMSWLTFVMTLQAQALLLGNGYAWIKRNAVGHPVSLYPLLADRTEPFLKDGRLWYETTLGSDRSRTGGQQGEIRYINPHNILHIKGMGFDGLGGLSVVTLARDSWGLGLAGQRHGSRYFKNFATPQGLLTVPEKPTEEEARRIRADWKELTSGDNEHDIAVLWGESDFKQLTMTNEDSQWLQSRHFQRNEVASWFNLPPHKVGDLDRATFSNITDQNRDYLQRSLMRWLVTWEEELEFKLLNMQEANDRDHNFEFDTDAFMRGDTMSRTESFATQFLNGKITLNEWRAADNQNSIGEMGDIRFVPMNMTTLERAAEGPEEQPQETEDDGQVGDQSGIDNDPGNQRPDRAKDIAVGMMTPLLRIESRKVVAHAAESKNFIADVERYYKNWRPVLFEAVSAICDESQDAEDIVNAYVARAEEMYLEVAGSSTVETLKENAEMAYSNHAVRAEELVDHIFKGLNA